MGMFSDARTWLAERLRPAIVEANPAVPLAPPTQAQVRRVGYEYGVQLGGTNHTQSAFSQERRQILDQLYQAYLVCPWVSGPIDLIARTATAGGLKIVLDDAVEDDGDVPEEPPEVLRLRRLLRFTNPREDMIQLLRSVAIDLMLFGDAYVEVVKLLGEPVALYTLDSTTMTVLCDEHGEVSGYKQDVDGIRSATFDTDQVIHISLDAPRGGVYGVAPAQKALLPVTAWLFWEATIKECGRRGDPPRIRVDLGNAKDTEVQRWREQYQVHNLGPKAVGNPVITTNGGPVEVLDPRKVGDYLAATKQLRDEIISCFGVPPAKLGIIESGNLGGGTSEGQDKTLKVNTIIPLQNLILEKLNYLLLWVGFDITGWHLEFGEIDFRDSKVIEDIRDMRVRNGVYSVNKARDEVGEPPTDGGDNPVIIDRQNMVLVRDLEAASQAGIAMKLRGTPLEPGEPTPGQPLALEKPKPEPVPTQLVAPLAPGEPADVPAGSGDGLSGRARKEARHLRDRRRLSESWQHAYRARRRLALEQLPTADMIEPREDPYPTDPYWDADAHNHNDRPDYMPRDLGLDIINQIIVNPVDVQFDHRYQRPVRRELADRYAREPRARLGQRVGLLAMRPDGSMWAVDGQHHTLGAMQAGLTMMTYQCFTSTGWQMESDVYNAYHRWHVGLHARDEDKVHKREAPKVPETARR